MDINDLAPELMEKAKACKTIEELEELARAEGIELSDEQLAGIAGGICRSDCTLHGAICRKDSSSPNLPDCTILFQCPVKFECQGFDGPIPE